MSRLQTRLSGWTIALCMLVVLTGISAMAKPQATSPDDQTSTTTKKKKKTTTTTKTDASAANDQSAAAADTAAAAAPASSIAPSNSVAPTATQASHKAATTTTSVSDSQISTAKASGMVWVNTASGIYHKRGRWYGKTKTGKFMSEADAKAAGYKASAKD